MGRRVADDHLLTIDRRAILGGRGQRLDAIQFWARYTF
jgi:hypothetical protein